MLQSLDRGNVTLDRFTGEFRIGLDQRAAKRTNIVQVVVGQTGFVGAPEQAVVEYLRSIYAKRTPPDLIITTGGPAAAFARRHRRELFPATPLLLASVDYRWLRDAPLRDNESAVPVVNDYPRLIDEILTTLPGTRQVFMIGGSGAIGEFWHHELDSAFARFHDRVAFVWSDELSLSDILRRVASLPPRSAIVYVAFGTDALGGGYADEQVIADIHATANAPLFAMQSPAFGYGIVGGSMLSIDDLARRTADVAGRILNGAPPSSARTPPLAPGQPVFDWRELTRWGIPESRLPAGSSVRYRSPTLWEEHRLAVLAAIGALVLQSSLIALLLYERRARQRAEAESRRNLALAADANRRETISALTASIGHELGQPLSAITHNAQALQLMIAANGTPPAEAAEILADINAEAILAVQIVDRHREMLRTHEMRFEPIDVRAVIDESLGLVAHELRLQQIEACLDMSSAPCVIVGDRVLLGQVFVNVIRNAMDAVVDTPPAKRRIAIRIADTAADVEISVRDTGYGLPADTIGSLFTPFVTTKSNGLGIGLAVAQRIVQAHSGTITAHNNVDAGATFVIALPRGTRSAASPGGRLRLLNPRRDASAIGSD